MFQECNLVMNRHLFPKCYRQYGFFRGAAAEQLNMELLILVQVNKDRMLVLRLLLNDRHAVKTPLPAP